MPKPKDTLSNESTNEKKKAPTGLGWASKLMGKVADKVANKSIYGEMESRNVAAADVPVLAMTGRAGGGVNNDQLNVITMPFVSPDSGKTHQIEGYHLPAQAGKPTTVFFGGTDMDRTAPHYQNLIRTMAEQAKRQGTGLIVMDYPSNANEGKIKAQVTQMQMHMDQNMGIPMNQQAYAGYSLGGNPALFAARTNPDASGLHLTSTVSSIRQESKNAMAAVGSISKIADKGQLSSLMDNIAETRQLIAAQQNRPGGPMPIGIAYSSQERFGEAGNNHMTPLLNEFNNYPGYQDNVKVQVSNFAPGANEDAHQTILQSPENITSMRDFLRDAERSVQARQALAAPPVAPVVAPVIVPPLPGADHDPDTESLTTSSDDTTSLSEGEEFEEEVDFDALGMEFDDDDDMAVDSQKAESPALSGSSSLRDSSSSSSDDMSEFEEEEIDDNGISFEPDEEEVDVDARSIDPHGADVEEEFDDFDLDLDQMQEQPGRDLLPHKAPEDPQEMKRLGQKYVEGERDVPSRITEVDGNEVSVKEKEWLRQMSNEAGRNFSPEQWAKMKNAGTTMYMDDDQRQQAQVGFAEQADPTTEQGTSVAVTDQDGRDLDGRNIFVMDQQGQMFAYNEDDSTKALKEDNVPGLDGNVPDKQVHVHHSSFLAGEDVAAAGEFVVGTNDVLRDQPLDQETADDLGVDARTVDVSVVKEVNNRSGHYLPGAQQALQSLDQFANQGVNLDNTKFTLHRSGADGGPTVVEGMAKEFTQGRASAEELQNAAGNDDLTAKLNGAAEKTFVARHDVMAELKQGQPALNRVDRPDMPDERSTDRPTIEFDDDDMAEPTLDLDDVDEESVDLGESVSEQKPSAMNARYSGPDDEADFSPGLDSDDDDFTVEEELSEDVEVAEAIDQKQENKPASYSAPGDDEDDFSPDLDSDDEELTVEEEVSEGVEVTESIEQKQDNKPDSYSIPGDDDDDFTLDVDSEDEELDMKEEVSEEIDVKEGEALEGMDKDQKQEQPAPAVSGPAEDGPVKAPSVRDSLRASAQKAGGDFQQAVKPNSLRANMKVEIGAQRAQAPAPKVGGPG